MFLSEDSLMGSGPTKAAPGPAHPTRPASARRRLSGNDPSQMLASPGSIPPPMVSGGRQVYTPSGAGGGDGSRPGTASVPVRPVSAATWNRVMTSNRYSDTDSGIGGDVLADPAPRPPGTPPMSAQDAQAAQAKLMQQKQLAAQKRMDRVQGGSIAQQNMSPHRPSTGTRRPGTASSRPGTSSGLSNMGNLGSALNSPGSPDIQTVQVQQQQHYHDQVIRPPMSSINMFSNSSEQAARADDLQRVINAKGMSIVYDPNAEEGESLKNPAKAPSPSWTLDVSDMRSFLMQTGPTDKAVQCYIVRDRSATKMYPKYTLYLNDNDRFMLSARKRKKSKTSNYLVSLDEDDTSRNSGNYFGKLRSNFLGTEFTIYDKGAKPGKGDSTVGVSQMSTRCEMGAVMYQYNVMGVRGPRKMTALVPSVDDNGRRKVFRANDADGDDDDDGSDDGRLMSSGDKSGKEQKDGAMVSSFKKGDEKDMIVMRNKPPKWNDALGAYCLNFNGRVTHASVKNFQLVADEDIDHVILQFGKVGKDTFTMDYAWPICAMQAFCICLTSFDNKLACE